MPVIVLDLDNTLLRSDKTISDYSIKILKRCQSADLKIVFATARSTQASERFLARFMPDAFVGYGGALVLAGEEVIHRFDIPAGISSRLIKDCLAAPEIISVLAINENVALTSNLADLEMTDSSHYQYHAFSENDNASYLKISLTASSQAAVEKIAAHYPMLDLLRYSGEDLYRFANRDALKWNAVQAVAAHYNISTEQFIAFGDDINDLEMLARCGTGVAVADAVDEAKAAADFICGSNDGDGPAHWLEEHLLRRA